VPSLPRDTIEHMAAPLSDEEFSAALEAAQRQIVEHAGYLEKQLYDGIARTVYAVLMPNRDELLGLLDRAASDANLAVELFQNVRRPVVRTQFEGAVMRGLHNYVASAMTLVDHTRRVMRDRSGPIVEEFERRKQEVVANPEVPFIQGLRNFVLHHSLPFVGHEVRLQPQPNVIATSEIQLSVRELVQWEGWSASTRAFIESHGQALTLRPIIRRHSELVVDLNLWLYGQLADENVDALAEVNELVVQRNAILGGLDMEEARSVTEEWTRRREDPAPSDPVDVQSLMGRRRGT
jgi:hypothetical protein